MEQHVRDYATGSQLSPSLQNHISVVFKHLSNFLFKGDPDYAAFYDRVKTSPEETVFNGVKEGLDRIKSGRNVMHVNYGSLLGFFQANPFHVQDIKVFGKGRPEDFSVIVPFNSPLKPILQKGTNAMIEGGTASFLLKKWEGKGIPVNPASDAMVLSAGQVLLVFIAILFTFSFTGIILCCEVCHKQLKSVKQKGLYNFMKEIWTLKSKA